MSILTRLYDFVAGTKIRSAQVDAELDQLVLGHNDHDTKIEGLQAGTGLIDGAVTNSKVATGIDMVKIADGSVTNTEVQYINSLSSNAQTQLDAKIPLTQKGAALGVVPLDSGAKIDISYIPSSIVDQMEYKGTWNAATNTPTLGDPATSKGWFYKTSVAGTYLTIDYAIGDLVISNGTLWEKIDTTDAVTSVFGRLGAILPNQDDYTFAQINKTVSSLADLATRSASDLNSGILPDARMPDLTGDITSAEGGVVTTIASNAVTTSKIADLNVTKAKIALLAIDTAQIADHAITAEKMDPVLLATDITLNAHKALAILDHPDASVTDVKIAAGIDATKIQNGITWTSRTSAADNNWFCLCYGNGLFVAVSTSGAGNRVMTSTDGINWTSRTSAADNAWISVCYGNGLFVAVGQSGTGTRVMTSPDGINWTIRTSAADNSWTSVYYGNGLFVAIAQSGTARIMTSPDGVTWTARNAIVDNSWTSLCFGKGLFVAVASSGTGDRVMTSPDGITWTSRTSAADNNWSSVYFGNGLFVAVSTDGTNRVMTSPDGITWTSRSAAAVNAWRSVGYGKGLFVAVSSDGTNRVMTSPDGITWTSRISAAANTWFSVCFGNGIFVASSASGTGNRVMSSGFADASIAFLLPKSSVMENLLTTTAATIVASLTPVIAGNFLVAGSFRVITGATNVTVTINYTNAAGAQVNTVYPLTSSAIGTYTIPTTFINAIAGSAITVKVTAGTASQVYVSTLIQGL